MAPETTPAVSIGASFVPTIVIVTVELADP